MGAQFLTAIGALLGTIIGIGVQESSRGGGNGLHTIKTGSVTGTSLSFSARQTGLMKTSLQWGDLLLPFTAGTFLYVGTVAVIPELLETNEKGPGAKWKEARKTMLQFASMALGAGIMLV